MPLATYVKNELGLDYAFANQVSMLSDKVIKDSGIDYDICITIA
jgi:hypothetical protein